MAEDTEGYDMESKVLELCKLPLKVHPYSPREPNPDIGRAGSFSHLICINWSTRPALRSDITLFIFCMEAEFEIHLNGVWWRDPRLAADFNFGGPNGQRAPFVSYCIRLHRLQPACLILLSLSPQPQKDTERRGKPCNE